MARKKSSLLARILIPPLIVYGGIMALWENEGRFDYAEAARKATVIDVASGAPAKRTISITGRLDTGIPIEGEYVDRFVGYHVVSRKAEIYAWDRDENDDGGVSWSREWQRSLQRNERNRSLQQTLSSKSLYPPRYRLDDLRVAPERIHFVDDYSDIAGGELKLNDAGRNAGLVYSGDYLYRSVSNGGAIEPGDERVSYTGIRNAPTATYFGLLQGGIATGKQFPVRGEPILSIGQFRFNLGIQDIIRNDGILHHVVNGDREQALQSMESHLSWLTWKVRLGGTAAIVAGIFMFFSFFVNLLYRIPVIGGLVRGGVFLLSLAIGLPVALIVMLSGLLVHNPWIGILPVALIAGVVYFFWRQKKTASENAQLTLQRYQSSSAPPARTADATAATSGATEATLSALLRLAMLEDALDDREKKFIVKWARKNGLSATRMQELFEQAKQDHGEVHATDRNDLVLMICLALVDGTLSTRELSVLNAIGQKIGLTRYDVRRIVVEVENGTLVPA